MKKYIFIFLLVFLIFLVGCSVEDEDDTSDSSNSIETKSDAKAITRFLFTMDGNDMLDSSVDAVINGSLISASVPYGVELTNLVASFTTTGSSVSVGNNTQESGVTTNDFSSDLSYTVTAEDDSTQSYIASVSKNKFLPTKVGSLTASDPTADAYFGSNPVFDDENGIAVFTDRNNVMHVFKRISNGNWQQSTTLTVSNTDDLTSYFKYSSAVSGGRLIISDPYQSVTNSSNLTYTKAGVVYVFEDDGNGNWSETILDNATINFSKSRFFGKSVDIEGDYMVIGANRAYNASNIKTGEAYIYKKGDNGWEYYQTLTPSDGLAYDNFGTTVAMCGDNIIVGATSKGSDSSGEAKGGAYIYTKSTSTDRWDQETILQASDQQVGDSFGGPLDISDNYAIIGAWKEDGGGTYTSSDEYSQAGAAYLFKKNSDGTWPTTETEIFHAEEMQASAQFGNSVHIDGNVLLISEPDRNLTDSSGDTIQNAGVVHVYELNDNNQWKLNTTLSESEPTASNTGFGGNIAFDGDTMLISRSNNSVVVDGETIAYAGEVYIFK